jgi:tRNA (mo5U34)-methyltransferase
MDAAQFLERNRAFCTRTRELGLGDVSRYYWYHTIDLGAGLITPGLYDYRETISSFPFPQDMTGLRVLDVGPATGFFSFEFERRGASVVAMELPSLRDLDRFPGQSVESSLARIERMIFPDSVDGLSEHRRRDSEREVYRCLLKAPFEFCRDRLGSGVERRFSTVYDLPANEKFDLVFVGDVLVHTLYPLKALASAAAACKGSLIFAQMLPPGAQEPPAMIYTGGADPNEDEVSWWLPNKSCLIEMLRKLGFARVREAGYHRGVVEPGAHPFERIILEARK